MEILRTIVKISIISLFIFPAYSQGVSIWLAPNLKSVINVGGEKLISGLKDVSVFKYYCDTVIKADDHILHEQLLYLQKKNIKIALECAPLSSPGYHLESFGDPLKILNVVDRVKNLGGSVSFVALDEPVYYAHYSNTGKRFVGWEMDKICINAAQNINPVYKKYPNILFGLIEPVNKVSRQDVEEFMGCFNKYTGHKLNFFHADVVWNRTDALKSALTWGKIMEYYGIRYGIIFNSSVRDAGNNEWIDSAESNIRKYAKNGQLKDVIIQSWNLEPQIIYPGANFRSITELPQKACNSFGCAK